ncbi:MAG: 50S ribosomal protein L28 [Alphaproteobacteria bacterium]|nr:50S ribosomal protein L28 [Alphaproteobacteria bacterium]
MSRTCDIIASKRPMSGHQISHSNRKAKRRFVPNLQNVTLYSDALKQKVRLCIATNTLRSVEKHGSLDMFLLATAGTKLTCSAKKLKKQIAEAHAA